MGITPIGLKNETNPQGVRWQVIGDEQTFPTTDNKVLGVRW